MEQDIQKEIARLKQVFPGLDFSLVLYAGWRVLDAGRGTDYVFFKIKKGTQEITTMGETFAKALDNIRAYLYQQGDLLGENPASPDDLRALGWSVAVHNDYRLAGVAHTFWLFTKGDRCVKGEGLTDAIALEQVRHAAAKLDAVQGQPHDPGDPA